MSIDEITLKLYLDGLGTVWYVDGCAPPANSASGLIPFMLTTVFNKAERVRVLGTHRNAHLITALFAYKLKGQLASVEVGSPLICTAARRTKPPLALLAMREENRAASLGGWHEVQIPEYHGYALISQMQKFGRLDDHARRLLKSHPAWKALSFIPHVSIDHCCYLLHDIIDPRWYVDPQHPGRVSKLNAFLGLSPKVAKACEEGRRARGSTQYYIVRSCWNNAKPDGDSLKLPANFLWRVNLLTEKQELVDLRTSQVFVAYLRHTWLDALYEGRQQERLFVPEHFFKLPAEAEAFKTHMAKVE